MALDKIPTLLRLEITKINADVCDIHQGFVRVRFPDGSGQMLDSRYKNNPERLQDLLFEWLSAHANAIRTETAKEVADDSR